MALARPRWGTVVSVIAVLFGVLTVVSGGNALFVDSAAVGDAVPFVLWFNFLAGFAYVLAGIGLFLWKRWAAMLSAGIAITTLVIFAAFVWHVANGGAFEMRTMGAMTVRSGIWIAIAIATCWALGWLTSKSASR
ncbi:MAG: hypothetical protein GY798_33140 [Hyphomicrobiales bacterium]|nr:hypothetical protein [Hyphomicrobiales bacterium]